MSRALVIALDCRIRGNDGVSYRCFWDRLAGTGDDQDIPIGQIVYSPSSNVEISSGRTYPTAVRQTVTLSFDDSLPEGSYRIELAKGIQTAAFNDQEADLLTDRPGFSGHPVVSLADGQPNEGSRVTAIDLVLASTQSGAATPAARTSPDSSVVAEYASK